VIWHHEDGAEIEAAPDWSSARECRCVPSARPAQPVVAGAIGDRQVPQPQRLGGQDRRRRPGIAPARQDIEDDVGGVDAISERDSGRPIQVLTLYLRVRTDDQSIEMQRRDLMAAIERHGWIVAAEFRDEGISGAKGRPSGCAPRD
jgi:hypothetical protein